MSTPIFANEYTPNDENLLIEKREAVNVYEDTIKNYNAQILTKSLTGISSTVDLKEKQEYIKEYDASIIRWQEYSDNELENYGFLDTQIFAIRNFDGTDEMRALASNKFTTSTVLNYRRYNASMNRTNYLYT